MYVWNYKNAWAQFGEGSPCISSSNVLGSCKSFGSCYSTTFRDVHSWDKWQVKNYDTCTYISEQGFQTFGTCCTTATATKPETPSFDFDQSSGGNKNQIYLDWPPPIPTHPPNHTPATHPTRLPDYNDPTQWQTTTQRTSTVWWQPPSTTTAPSTTRRTSTIWWQPPSTTMPPSTQRPTTQRPTTYPGWPLATQKPPSDDSEGGHYGGSCGEKNGGSADQERIVGGQNAEPNEWPWIAVLFNAGRQFCGGSLIDDSHILTAAHCIAQ